MDYINYKTNFKKISRHLNFYNYKIVKETQNVVIYDLECSHLIIPKKPTSTFLFFMLFCQDEKVIEYYETSVDMSRVVSIDSIRVIKEHITKARTGYFLKDEETSI
jgi:hypothetical protein